jgi:hypothetical protein
VVLKAKDLEEKQAKMIEERVQVRQQVAKIREIHGVYQSVVGQHAGSSEVMGKLNTI